MLGEVLVGSLRTKDKDGMRSIGGRILLMKPIKLRRKRVRMEITYQFSSIDKRTKRQGGSAVIHPPIIL